MSWDIFVQDIPAEARTVGDIPDDFRPRPLGRRDDIVRRILEVAPGADFTDPSWGSFEGPDFSIEFNLGEDVEVTSFALHVRGGDTAAGLVAELLDRNGWRAFDPVSDSGIFDRSAAAASMRRWRAYRDRMLDSDDASQPTV